MHTRFFSDAILATNWRNRLKYAWLGLTCRAQRVVQYRVWQVTWHGIPIFWWSIAEIKGWQMCRYPGTTYITWVKQGVTL